MMIGADRGAALMAPVFEFCGRLHGEGSRIEAGISFRELEIFSCE